MKSWEDVGRRVALFKNKIIVLAGGCFDIIHFGHIIFLQKAKQEGDILIVALESDEYIKRHKGRKPVHNQNERAVILSSLRVVDLVIKLPYLQSDKDYFKLVEKIKPDVIAITRGDERETKKRNQAKAVEARLKIVTPKLSKFSSSKIQGL
jgi:rfaE bifunctional protein nucleotidyltransferase chain/domain